MRKESTECEDFVKMQPECYSYTIPDLINSSEASGGDVEQIFKRDESVIFQETVVNQNESLHSPLITEDEKRESKEESEWTNLEKAACLVEQALHGRNMPLEIIHSKNVKFSHTAYLFYHYLGFIRYSVVIAFFILPFFEKPMWCNSEAEDQPCSDPSLYPLSGLPYLSYFVVLTIEGFCILLLIGFLILQKCYLGNVSFKKNRVFIYKSVLLVCIIIDRTIFVLKLLELFPNYNFELAPFLRVFLAISFSRSIRGCFRIMFRILAGFFDILILLSLFIVFFSWIAFLLFGKVGLTLTHIDDMSSDVSDDVNTDNPFRSFSSSLLSLFILLTTANNPNVWIELYVRYRLSFIFFFLYISVGLFILMNLILSVIYNGYKSQMNARKEKSKFARHDALMCAFELLDYRQQGWLDASQLNKLFLTMSEFKQLPNVRSVATEVFLHLDQRGDFVLHPHEFSNLCHVLEHQFLKSKSMSKEGRTILRGSAQSWLNLVPRNFQSFIRSKIFDIVCDIGLLVTFGLILMETMLSEEYIKNELIKAEYAIGMVWTCEIFCKIPVFGFVPFFEKILNKFDFFVLICIVSAELSGIFGLDNLTNLNWIRYALALRMFRLVSLSSHLPHMQMIHNTFTSLFPLVLPVLGLQFCVCSLFSLLGVHIFGGKIFYQNALLENTEYAENHFESLNYNDFASAMVTSFCLCVVNNWYVIMEGFVAATSVAWTRLFFISFYVIAVVFALNVVVAFVLENILDEAERTSGVRKEAEERRESENSVRSSVFLSKPLNMVRNFSFDNAFAEEEGSYRFRNRFGD